MKIFHTIKSRFRDINTKENVWLSEKYNNHIKKKLKSRINHNHFFSILNILIFFLKKKEIITLDYGGGAGEYFYKLYFNNQTNNKVIIYDNPIITNIGKKINKFSNLKFINNIKEIKYKKINFLLFSSVAQYIENLSSKIKEILHLKPDFIIFEDFHATKNKSFVTYQQFFEYKIPVKFHKIKNLQKFMKKNRYELIHKTSFLPLIKGEFKFYDMKNLPKKNRVNNTFTLIFKKF